VDGAFPSGRYSYAAGGAAREAGPARRIQGCGGASFGITTWIPVQPAIFRRGLRAGACRLPERGAPCHRAAGITLQLIMLTPLAKVTPSWRTLSPRKNQPRLRSLTSRSTASTSVPVQQRPLVRIWRRDDWTVPARPPTRRQPPADGRLIRLTAAREFRSRFQLPACSRFYSAFPINFWSTNPYVNWRFACLLRRRSETTPNTWRCHRT
jgi:hypothetical protein